VLAALATSRRGGGEPADRAELAAVEREAAEREAELRLAYELELEREVAARREVELRAENDVRRETEQAMRTELSALRGELAQVAELRRDMAQVAELRRDMAQVAELRRDVAALGELRAGLSRLGDLRGDLAQLAELRADVGRLRTELTEQLSGEMLVERIMLRTQSFRSVPGTTEPPATRTIDAAGWSEPAPELTAARPALRLEDLPGDTRTRQVDGMRAEQPAATATFAAASPPPPPLDWLAERALVEPEEADSARRSRHAEAEYPQPPSGQAPHAERRRRHTDEPYRRPPVPAEQLTEQRPAIRPDRPAPGPARSPAAPEESAASSRLAEILAENGVAPSSSGRRRRRYREDDDGDDVLSRVLRRQD
jgi:hypothetical protein